MTDATVAMPIERTAGRLSVAEIFSPRSVAVIGASEDVAKFGGRVLHHLTKHSYGGRIVPVNPRRSALFGIPTAPDISVAGPIDVAVVALPADQLEPCVAACAAAGVGAVVIITSQLGEIGGEGAEREQRIIALARNAGMRIVGPNCLGFVNVGAGLALTPSFAMEVERLPVGSIGVVSQSGALMATMFNRGHDLGIGFSTLASLGNQADVTENEVFAYLIADADTRAIVLYIEGLSNGRRFLALAGQARAVGKPVVVVKAGRSEAGRRTTFSHTASLAGPFRLFKAAASACGVVLVDEPEVAISVADALLRWPRGLPPGKGVAPISGSGGGAAIVADRLGDVGFSLPTLAPATQARLAAQLPAGQPLLPLDAGALRDGFTAAAVGDALTALAQDDSVGALIYQMTTQPQMANIASAIGDIGRSAEKPALLVLTAGSVADDTRAKLRRAGHFFLDRLDDALRVLRALADHAVPPPESGDAFEALAVAALNPIARLPTGALIPPEALTLVAVAGVPIPDAAVVANLTDAVAAAKRLGYPVALKLIARDVVHKSDRGGVRLDLADSAQVAAAARDIARAYGGRLDGLLVQRSVRGVAELLVGSVWDDAFGPFVLVGSGGVFAELFDDVRLASAPLARGTAEALVGSLRIWPVLDGARGQPRADVAAAVDAIVAIGRLAAALGPRLTELEINPLIVRAEGGGAMAVDARARLGDPQREASA